jgi:hypothetical protein
MKQDRNLRYVPKLTDFPHTVRSEVYGSATEHKMFK